MQLKLYLAMNYLPPMTMKDVLDFAYADKVVFADTSDPNAVTKAEVAALVSIQGLQTVYRNMEKLEEVSNGTLHAVSGPFALHIMRQLSKPSTDKLTEGMKKVVNHRGTHYLVRTYKFVDADYFKVEVTRAMPDHLNFMDLKTTVGGSVKLLRKVIGGGRMWLLPHYMSRKDFVPVTTILNDD
mgnify:CR=1 FL=1